MATAFLLLILCSGALFWHLGRRAEPMGRTAVGYYLHNGSLKQTPLIGTLVASNVSLGNMVYVCAIWGYFYGWSGVLWVSVCIVALSLGMVVFAPKFKTYIEDRKNSGSLHGYLQAQFSGDSIFSERLRMVAAVITFISLMLALAIEAHLAATVLSPMLGVNEAVLVVVSVGLISLYSAKGGFKGVVQTDLCQAIFFLIGLGATFLFFVNIGGGSLHLGSQYSISWKETLIGAGLPNMLGITILGFGWMLVTADSWQRNCATRSMATSVKGMIISGIILTAVVAFCGVVGMGVKSCVEANLTGNTHLSGGAMPWNDIFLFTPRTVWQQGLLVTIAFGLLMAALSTMDTFLVVSSQALVVDIFLGVKRKRSLGVLSDAEDQQLAFIGQLVTGCLVLAVLAFWGLLKGTKLLGDPVTLFYITYSLQFSLFVPVVVGALSKRRSAFGAFCSVVVTYFLTLVLAGVAWFGVVHQAQWTIITFSPTDVLALLPVFTVAIGMMAYILTSRVQIKNVVKPNPSIVAYGSHEQHNH